MSEFIPVYDLESLSEQQRQEYIKSVCKHIGVPDNLNLVCLTYLDDGDGPRRLVPYAKRGATEIIRSNRNIAVTGLKQEMVGGSVVWTATGVDKNGRQEMSSGSKYIKDLTGRQLDDAIMTAQTRACRRMTLQFLGAGILDESEVNPSEAVVTQPTVIASVPLAPVVQVNTAPGTEVPSPEKAIDNWKSYPVHATVDLKTGETTLSGFKDGHQEKFIPPKWQDESLPKEERQKLFEEDQAKMRADAIASLNKKHEEVTKKAEAVGVESQIQTPPPADIANAEPKPKRKYTRRHHVDLGVSAPAAQAQTAVQQPVTPPAQVAPKEPEKVPVKTVESAQAKAVAEPSAPPSVAKKLTTEQLKPYRQRQFKIMAELEANGFVPKEGKGNLDKLRDYVNIMFPEVTNFTDMTTDHWEAYLSRLEAKLKAGAKQAIQDIEDAIGL